jgi:hypothetical protein
MLPDKNSRKWFLLFLIYAVVIFLAFLATKLRLGDGALNRGLKGILIISVFTSLVPCIGGYMGKRIFFTCYTISVIIGLAYSVYAVFADIAPGWSELTSIIGYLFIVGIGFIVAANAELISFFLKNRKRK